MSSGTRSSWQQYKQQHEQQHELQHEQQLAAVLGSSMPCTVE
jgi:hypothetical protein